MIRGNTVYANFNNQGKERNVQETIEAFFSYKCKNENTRKAYERDIVDFFDYLCRELGKPFELITEADLHFEIQEIVKYRTGLEKTKQRNGERKYKNKSINRKMATLKSLWDWFASNGYNVNPMAFRLEDLSENDSEEIDAFTWDEVQTLVEKAKEMTDGLDRSLMIKLASMTAIRLQAIVQLKWKDIKMVNGIPVIHVVDKGNKLNKKPIHPNFYQELLQLKGDKGKEDKVFKYLSDAYQDTVTRIAKECGMGTDGRKLSFHSLKKAAVTQVWSMTNDIKVTQEFADHASPETTINTYVKPQEDMTQKGSYLLGQELDMSKLDGLSKEELLNVIMQCSLRVKNEIINKVN